MSKLVQFVHAASKIAFDSNVLIGLIEEQADYALQAVEFFDALKTAPNTMLWTSVLTVPEVLEHPIRRGNLQVVNAYRNLFEDSTISFAEIDESVAHHTTTLMEQYGLRTRDALHLASLLGAGVDGFVTADSDFKSVTELAVFVISSEHRQRHR